MTVMGSDTEYLPDEITYGFVADRVLLAIGDTTGDYDRFPDGVPAKGTVKFSPERTILYTQETPATVLPQDIECTIYHRDHPVAVNNGYEPELVGKLVDPAGHVGNVALIVGWYEAVYRLETGTAQRFRFKVLPEHTADNPLWLPEVAPLTPTPSERFVVNEQVYNDTKTARDQAEQFRDTTRTLRNETETYRNQAEGYRDEAGQSATSAAEILSDVQDLGITVDTSVGTRVFVGDTMIHGDTGWRALTEWDAQGNVTGHQLTAAWEPMSNRDGGIYIRRVNEVVYYSFRRLERVGTSPTTVWDTSVRIPASFRGENGVAHLSGMRSTTEQAYMAVDNSGIMTRGSGDTLGTNGEYNFTDSIVTSAPWPTSLPGSPV